MPNDDASVPAPFVVLKIAIHSESGSERRDDKMGFVSGVDNVHNTHVDSNEPDVRDDRPPDTTCNHHHAGKS